MGTNKPAGYWPVWENAKKELTDIATKIGHFPTQNELRSRYLKASGLISAIFRYHGGFKVVREKMGYGQLRKPRGYWPVWENAKKELTDITLKLGHFPSGDELRGLNASSLATAISTHHGGMVTVREKMGYGTMRKPEGYWPVWENAKKELTDITLKLGHFPTYRELVEGKQSSLAIAITKYHGGFPTVRERMGFLPLNELENSDLESLLEEYVSS